MYMPKSKGHRPEVWAYISGKSQVLMLCTTSGTLKIYPNLKETAQLVYIVADADFNGGRLF